MKALQHLTNSRRAGHQSVASLVSVAALLFSTAACGGGGDGPTAPANPVTPVTPAAPQSPVPPPIPARVLPWSATTQSALAGTPVLEDPTVAVIGANGVHLGGISVTCSVYRGGGSVPVSGTVTDWTGVATCGRWTLGVTPGENVVLVSVGDLTPAVFSATARDSSFFEFYILSTADGNAVPVFPYGNGPSLNGGSYTLAADGTFTSMADWSFGSYSSRGRFERSGSVVTFFYSGQGYSFATAVEAGDSLTVTYSDVSADFFQEVYKRAK